MSRKIIDMMKVGRLKSILAKYDDEQVVAVGGGEDENGDFGYLVVSENKDDAIWCCGDVILEYRN